MQAQTYKLVGDGAHRVVTINGQTNEEIADQSDDKHDAMQGYEHPFVLGGENVSLDLGEVVNIRQAIVVCTFGRVGYVIQRAVE